MVSSKNNKIYELLNKNIVIPVTNKINEHSKHLKNNTNEIYTLKLWVKILIAILIINVLFSFYLFISNIKTNNRLEEVFAQSENNTNRNEENVNTSKISVEESNTSNNIIEQKNYNNTDNTINNSSNNNEEIGNYNSDNQNSQPQSNYSETYENNNQSNNTKYNVQENYDDDTPPAIENVERNKNQQNSNDQNNNSSIDDLRSKKEQLLKELNDY